VSRGWREPPSVPLLEQNIDELRVLYREVFHDDVDIVDDEFVEFADGSTWTVSHGRIPPTLSSLEEQLAEVWDMYIDTMLDDADSIMLLFGSFGRPTTTRSQKVKLSDGSWWNVERGRNPPTLETLAEKLAEVQQLLESMETERDESPIMTKSMHTKLGVVSSAGQRSIFGAAQFGRATRFDRKANKKDWMLSRNQAPMLERGEHHEADCFMQRCEPTERHRFGPTNGLGRKLRRSTRYQDRLLRQKASRDLERRRRNQHKELCIDRKMKFLCNLD
jgi:hypothetical protein